MHNAQNDKRAAHDSYFDKDQNGYERGHAQKNDLYLKMLQMTTHVQKYPAPQLS